MASASFLDGLALAATLAGDRGSAIDAGLSVELAGALATRIQEIRSRGRERALATIAEGLRPTVDPGATLPPRAAAILATEVPRAIGATWMARGPLPRPGFRVPAALRASLRRLARPKRSVDAVASDRRGGRRVLLDALAAGRDELAAIVGEELVSAAQSPPDEHAPHPIQRTPMPRVAAWAKGLSSERAAPPTDEAPAGRAPVKTESSERRAVLVRALARSLRGEALIEALGRAEHAAIDAEDRWARAGRETRALWERGCRG